MLRIKQCISYIEIPFRVRVEIISKPLNILIEIFAEQLDRIMCIYYIRWQTSQSISNEAPYLAILIPHQKTYLLYKQDYLINPIWDCLTEYYCKKSSLNSRKTTTRFSMQSPSKKLAVILNSFSLLSAVYSSKFKEQFFFQFSD